MPNDHELPDGLDIDHPLPSNTRWSQARMPCAAATINGAIDWLHAHAHGSLESVGRAEVVALLTRHLGPGGAKWCAHFVPSAAVVRGLVSLRSVLPVKATSPPPFYRGCAVEARYTQPRVPTARNPNKYTDQAGCTHRVDGRMRGKFYEARVLGAGQDLDTLTVYFDPDEGKDRDLAVDTHRRTPAKMFDAHTKTWELAVRFAN